MRRAGQQAQERPVCILIVSVHGRHVSAKHPLSRTSGKSHLTVNSYSALPVHPREPRKGILKADQPLPALKTPTDGSLHMDAWISHQTWPGPCSTFCYRTPAIKPPVPPSGVSKLWPSGQIWPIACFC